MSEGPDSPWVWGRLTQEALDRAYDQTHWAPNMAALRAARAQASAAFLAQFGAPLRIAYGEGPFEGLDVYRSATPRPGVPTPTLVFVHGGGWRQIRATDYACLAAPVLAAGCHVAMLDFSGVEEAGGDLMVLFAQVQRGLACLATQGAALGVEPTHLHLLGYSSGAHLAAALVTEPTAPPVRSALLVSGMYELEPVRRSKRSAYVAFTDASVAALSPIRHVAHLAVPVTLAVGTHESPEFIRQTQEMAAAIQQVGQLSGLIVVPQANHFEMLDAAANPKSPLGAALLATLTR